MTNFKKQHYLSQCYLKGFQTENICNGFKTTGCYFWDILKNPSGNLKGRNFSSIHNIAYKNHLFSFISYKGDTENYIPFLETEFSKFELPLSILLENIKNKYKIFSKTKNFADFYKINYQEKTLLTDFFKFQFKRSLKAHNNFDKDIERLFDKIVNGKEIEDRFGIDTKNELIKNDKFKELLIKNGGVQSIINLFSSINLNNILLKKNWYFLIITDKDKSFVTSDFPIYRFNEDGRNDGIIEETTQIIFPLTNKIALLLYGKGGKTNYQIFNDNNYIKRINGMSIANANNLVISSNIKLLKKMTKIKNQNGKYSYRENKYFNLNN